MFEISFIIESEKIRSNIFQYGEVAAFDNQNQNGLVEVAKSYCIADSSESAIEKVIKRLAVRIKSDSVQVRSITKSDEVFKDWLMEACRSRIMAGEIISIVKQQKI